MRSGRRLGLALEGWFILLPDQDQSIMSVGRGLVGDEFGSQYEAFRALLDVNPPAEAVKILRQFGIGYDIFDQIGCQHAIRSIEIRELTERRLVTMPNSGPVSRQPLQAARVPAALAGPCGSFR